MLLLIDYLARALETELAEEKEERDDDLEAIRNKELVVVDFGAHRGETYENVLTGTPSYLCWTACQRGSGPAAESLLGGVVPGLGEREPAAACGLRGGAEPGAAGGRGGEGLRDGAAEV